MEMLGEFQSATAAIPSAKYGSVEVRPLMVMGSH
jgi:hypothetical protein